MRVTRTGEEGTAERDVNAFIYVSAGEVEGVNIANSGAASRRMKHKTIARCWGWVATQRKC